MAGASGGGVEKLIPMLEPARIGPQRPLRRFGFDPMPCVRRYGGLFPGEFSSGARCRKLALRAIAMVSLIVASCGTRALAQTAGGGHPSNNLASGIGDDEPEFVATVRNTLENAHRFKVPRNRSIIIETSLPLTRVDVVGKDMVRVEAPSAKQLLVTGENYGVTQVIVWTEGGQRKVFEITVELDLELLNATIKDMDPQSDARALSIMGNVLLTGTVSSATVAEQIEQIARLYLSRIGTEPDVQNQLRIAGEQQVLLKCVVAEVSRSAVRDLGINGFLAGENFGDGFVVSQIGGINPIPIGPAPGINVESRIPFLTGDIPLGPNPTLSLGFPDIQMQLFIRALANNTLLRILAEPTLVAVSGETASFLAGGEFPIPVPQAGQAAGAITIVYREFGINLLFTPLVLPHQRIRINVQPEVSARDEAGGIVTPSGFVPALTTRRVSTTVEVGSGATIAIAGLLRDEVRGVTQRVPGIGDLPVLGALFRSVNFQRSRTELVILVTPEIVAPMHGKQVPKLPGGDLADPSDLELYLLGALEGRTRSDDADESFGDDVASRRLLPTSPELLSLHGPWGHENREKP